MQTRIIEFNKENWSGEIATLAVTRFAEVDEFTVSGYKIELRDRFRVDDDEPKFAWTHFRVYIDGRPSDYSVGRFDQDAQWECVDESGEFSRFGDTAAEAAAKVLFNTL